MAGPLGDAAVDDDVLVFGDPERLVEGPELLGAFEGAVGVHRFGPGDVLRPGDVAGAEGPLLGVVGHVGELPAVLLGATHVHQGALAFLHLDDVLQDVVPVGPDGLVPVGDLVAPRG